MSLRFLFLYFLYLGISLIPFSEHPDPPSSSICLGRQNEDIDCDGELGLWSVMAKAPHGYVPGKIIYQFLD